MRLTEFDLRLYCFCVDTVTVDYVTRSAIERLSIVEKRFRLFWNVIAVKEALSGQLICCS